MDEKQPFEKTIEGLIEEISVQLDAIMLETGRVPGKLLSQRTKVKELTALRDGSVEDLRLFIKYLLFDLDATRRENIYLKKLLDNPDS